MSSYTIYGTEGSPFVRKVLLCLAEKGLAHVLEEVNVFDPPDWFLAMSPARRIPVLQVEGHSIADSSAICGYLERAHPLPPLYPEAAIAYGRALWYEEYADTVVAAAIGFGLLRTLLTPPRNGQPQDLPAARKALHEKLPPIFDYLEGEVRGKTFLIGDSLSIADISLGAQLMGLTLTRVPLDAGRWPELDRYFTSLLSRPSFDERLDAVRDLIPDVAPDLG